MRGADGFSGKVTFIWSVADLLRGDYKPHEYGQVILPLTVLRRLDCVLEPTKDAVVARAINLQGRIDNLDPILLRTAGQPFYNTSPLNFSRLLDDPANVAGNLRSYIAAYSTGAVEVLDKYGLDGHITRLDNAGLLYHVLARFADIDLHPDAVPNEAMGYVFEELLRKFSEMSNETAGEHFTPREVIRLMVNILFSEDDDALRGTAPVRTMFDPACGTGGMLTGGQEHMGDLNPRARLEVFGQELNPETWAIARSDLMIKGQDPDRIMLGNSFTNDGFAGQRFDYMLANPPFGVDWKRIERQIKDEHAHLGDRGRFGVGLPRVSDGSLLFLQHMLAKMKPVDQGGSRGAIVFSGSPLFSGGAGSGESEIRRWIIENDWLEGIVALPDQMFYNTGISTYFWILTNRKTPDRQGKVVLLDAREQWAKMRKSLGDKRKHITDNQIADITRLYHDALEQADHDERVKVFNNADFGYQRITVERPMRRRWTVTTEAVDAVAASKVWVKWEAPDPAALYDLIGKTYDTEEALASAAKKLRPEPGAVYIDGTRLRHVRVVEPVYEDWNAVRGDDGALYDLGYDADREYWTASEHDTEKVMSEDAWREADAFWWLDGNIHLATGCADARCERTHSDDYRLAEPWDVDDPEMVAEPGPVLHVAVADPSTLPTTIVKELLKAAAVAEDDAPIVTDRKGNPLPDADLRDNENVPLGEDIDAYMQREVLSHVPDAWVDHAKTKTGYEVPFTRHFYKYVPPRPIAEIDADIDKVEAEIQHVLQAVIR